MTRYTLTESQRELLRDCISIGVGLAVDNDDNSDEDLDMVERVMNDLAAGEADLVIETTPASEPVESLSYGAISEPAGLPQPIDPLGTLAQGWVAGPNVVRV